MKKFEFKSIRARLTYWFLLLTLIPLMFVLYLTYTQRAKALELSTFAKLTAIRDLKVKLLHNWLEERTGDMKTLSEDSNFIILENITNRDYLDQNDVNTIRNILNRYLRNYRAYTELSVIDPKTGKIIVSTQKSLEGTDKSYDSYFKVPLKTGELYIKDIYYSRSTSRNEMVYSIPIFNVQHKGKHIIGILLARVDLKNSLYKMLLDRVGLGKTGETLIVNKNVVALNELRWYDNAPLNLKIKAEPAVNAAQGKTGLIITTDYRDEKVIAAYTYIPQTKWGFIIKQDLYELNAPIREMALSFLIIFIIISLVISVIAVSISKTISKPIVEMNYATKKISDGDYSVRNVVTSHDELGLLAESINEMTNSVESKIITQKGVTDISSTMIGQSSMLEFGSELLKQLMEITGSNMSVFYILNEVTSEFEHLTSIGANKELLKPFNSKNPEGEFGNAILNKNIYYLKDIPEDTIFKFQTTAGDAVPKEIITIPILVDNTVVALISLVNIHRFRKECYIILEQSLLNINSSYSSLISNERTRILAENILKANQQLKAQTEELQSQTEELQQTSEELEEQNLELEMQQKQLENASKLKSDFLSNMSHELRTPLNSVLALSKIMQLNENNTLSEEELNYLSIIEKNGTQLLNLINDILDLTKIEAGRMETIFEQISINDTVNQIYLILTPLAKDKDLAFSLNLSDENIFIQSDEVILTKILRNLIGNAVKFTRKGSVNIKVHSTDDNVIIDVIDTGIGIKKEELGTIFEQFRQVDSSSTRDFEGTGLGLTIALKSANILGGTINVKSKINKGSTFSLVLPKNISTYIDQSNILPISKITNKYSDKDKILVIAKMKKIVEKIKSITGQDLNFAYLPSIKNIFKENFLYKRLPVIIDENFLKTQPKKDIKVFSVLISKLKIPLALLACDNPDEEIRKLFKTKKSLCISIKKLETESADNVLMKFLTESIEEAKDFSKRNVLLIDDNEEAVIQVKHILEELDINTSIANSGKEAIELALKIIPDAIILDLMMPGIDGFKVLETIRSKIETKFIPVIILTAKDLTKADIGKLTVNNVNQIMIKGDIKRKDLVEVIKDLFEINLPKPEKIIKIKSSEIKYKNKTKKNILIVEDNPDNLLVLTASLKNRYNILTATDGKTGLELALKKKPELILLDLLLPIMDGYKVAEKLKKNINTKDIPIIAVTAKAMKGDKEKVLESGFDNYMSKPIDPEKLLKLVEKYI